MKNIMRNLSRNNGNRALGGIRVASFVVLTMLTLWAGPMHAQVFLMDDDQGENIRVGGKENSLPSTAERSHENCWQANCSVTKEGHLPVPVHPAQRESLNMQTEELCSWMKSETCLWICRFLFCVCCRNRV